MPLAEYRRKRDFKQTAEPRGKRAASRGRLYVIQKHDASHLHYDFRLELDGVLKSWAVPKGPSLDPAQKRLAVHVEDHPVEYGSFEGMIPEGQYGGGTVLLWDKGYWEPVGDPDEGYRQGKLKFRLHGKKLTGGWMLVRSGGHGRDPRQWLLIKERDDAVRSADDYNVTEAEPLSVASRRDLEQIATGKSRVWNSNVGSRKATKSNSKPATKSSARKKGSHKRLPKGIEPQLATLVKSPPEGDEWGHEIKFDGYRILAYVDGDEVRLESRKALDWTQKFPELAAAIAKVKLRQGILDGEVVAINDRGVSDFQALQEALSSGQRGRLIYYAFDLLWQDGDDLRALPLAERQERLSALRLPVDRGAVRQVEHVVDDGAEFFAQAEKLGLEGIISKRLDRPYRGGRGTDWLKIKAQDNAEFVIGGFTNPSGARHGFGALLLGYYDKSGGLSYAGRVGTGFSDALLADLTKKLRAMETEKSPFAGAAIKRERHAHWVQPKLVAQIRYSNWTRDGLLRHPAFLGLREDKPPRNVHREQAKSLTSVAPKAVHQKTSSHSSSAAHGRNGKAARAAGRGDSTESTVAGQRLTHPDKLLYPDEGVTKQDLAEYYLAAAGWMLPHVEDRPLSIVRCPDGLNGPKFFQKHPGAGMLESLKRVSIQEKSARGEYVLIRDVADLVALVQVSALELHVWGSRADAIEKPDRLVFDLDPAPDVPWKRVKAAAREVRAFLQDLGLESFLKTTGGKGFHLVVPVERRHDWDYVSHFCQRVAVAIAQAAPKDYIAKMTKSARAGKIYVDYLRNQRGATSVAAYSTRARAGAPVSMPISWDELDTLTSADHFQFAVAKKRLATLRRDPWAKIFETRQGLTSKMLKHLEG